MNPLESAASPQAAPAEALPRILRMQVAVLMLREAKPNVWEDWRFRLLDVWPDDGRFGLAAGAPHCLRQDDHMTEWAFPGLTLELYPDEAEGYQLNLTSGQPVWFVMWRVDDEDPSLAAPERVTLSYLEAGRLLDAQERVDNCPLPPDMVELLQAYTEAHYHPEPRRRQRPASFRAPDERGRKP